MNITLLHFSHVSSLHWSSDTGESHCYLCVVHTSVVSLWKVDGSSPKLSFKQIRKIHATPILQGMVNNRHLVFHPFSTHVQHVTLK